jgi:hypothetical protein
MSVRRFREEIAVVLAYLTVTSCVSATILGVSYAISRSYQSPTYSESFWGTFARQEVWTLFIFYINYFFRRREGVCDKFVIASYRTIEKACKIAIGGEVAEIVELETMLGSVESSEDTL